MRAALAAALCACAALVPAADAEAATAPVSILFAEFLPSQLDVLPGETVEWTNISERRHTVTADDASFDSGDVNPEERFAKTFDAVGAYLYHCTVHFGMTGEVDVRRVTLGPLPGTPSPAGDQIELVGRTADAGTPVTIEADSGAGFRPVATGTSSPDGTWKATVTAVTTADVRAVLGGDTSQTRRLLVSDRKLIVRATRRGLAVSAVPPAPYARVMLQLDLRERFGWWPAVPGRLDFLSAAEFRVKRPARARVVLVDRDGWTPLVVSAVLNLGRGARQQPAAAPHPGH
jgi:plastocyanin